MDGWLQLCRVKLFGRCLGLADVSVGLAGWDSAGAALPELPSLCRAAGFPGDVLGDLWVSSKVFSFMILDE